MYVRSKGLITGMVHPSVDCHIALVSQKSIEPCKAAAFTLASFVHLHIHVSTPAPTSAQQFKEAVKQYMQM